MACGFGPRPWGPPSAPDGAGLGRGPGRSAWATSTRPSATTRAEPSWPSVSRTVSMTRWCDSTSRMSTRRLETDCGCSTTAPALRCPASRRIAAKEEATMPPSARPDSRRSSPASSSPARRRSVRATALLRPSPATTAWARWPRRRVKVHARSSPQTSGIVGPGRRRQARRAARAPTALLSPPRRLLAQRARLGTPRRSKRRHCRWSSPSTMRGARPWPPSAASRRHRT
mmetsp:Transcript_134250/g.388639  ORF Transcript_134250/g.388639 Transcript_134250/m.388639 type:complete len:229 (+) Transcript_134250:265-951(+)